MNKSVVTLVLCIILSSCASTGGGYIEPLAGEPSAIIKNSGKTVVSQFNWNQFFVHKVDGIEISYSKEFWSNINASDASRRVKPGIHNLEIAGSFNTSFSAPGPYEVYIPIDVNIEEGVTYKLKAEVNESGVAVWLVNENNSEVASSTGTLAITF